MARLSDNFLHNDRAKDASAWHELRGGVRLHIAWFYSEAFQKALADSAKGDEAKRVFAEHLLLGWENIEDESGNPIEPTVENRLDVMLNYNEIFGEVVQFSQNPENFLIKEEVAKELGN